MVGDALSLFLVGRAGAAGRSPSVVEGEACHPERRLGVSFDAGHKKWLPQ